MTSGKLENFPPSIDYLRCKLCQQVMIFKWYPLHADNNMFIAQTTTVYTLRIYSTKHSMGIQVVDKEAVKNYFWLLKDIITQDCIVKQPHLIMFPYVWEMAEQTGLQWV